MEYNEMPRREKNELHKLYISHIMTWKPLKRHRPYLQKWPQEGPQNALGIISGLK